MKAELATGHGGTSKILILVICAAIIIGILLFFFGENFLKPVGKKESPEKLPDQIEIIETEQGKIVRNKAEGYEVTVPKEWEVPKVHLLQEKIRVDKYGPGQKIETELQDGVVLSMYVKNNPENLSINEWAQKYWRYSPDELISIKIEDVPILKTIEKVTYAEDIQGNPVFIEDSMKVDLAFINNGKYYNFSCEAVGPEYQKYVQECENLAIENIKKFSL